MAFLGSKDRASFLRKRKWTGEQAGRAVVLDKALTYKNKLEGKDEEFFTGAEIQKISSTLTSEKDYVDYNNYIALCRWLSTAGLLFNAHYGLFDAGIKRLLTIFTEAENAQQLFTYVSSLPVIMTQADYDEKEKAAIDKELHSNDSYYSIYQVVFMILGYYKELLVKSPRKANPLKTIKAQYEGELVKAGRILGQYNTLKKIGYYTINGKRTDELTEQEYRAAICPPSLSTLLNTPVPDEQEQEEKLLDYALQKLNAEYEGKDTEKIKAPVFHADETPPANLTKWSMLLDDDLELYFEPVEDATEEQEQELYRAFYKEFKQAIDLLLLDADKLYNLGLAKYPVSQWGELIPLVSLYECNFYGYANKLQGDVLTLGADKRAIENGIAILRPYDFVEQQGRQHYTIDRQGHYLEPLSKVLRMFITGIDQFTDNNPNKEQALEELDKALEGLANEYFFLVAYDKAIRIVSDFANMPELEIFCPNLEKELGRIKAVQNSFRLLHKEIAETDSPLDIYKEQKLGILESRLCTIELGELEIRQENIAELQADLKGFRAFRAQRELVISTLLQK